MGVARGGRVVRPPPVGGVQRAAQWAEKLIFYMKNHDFALQILKYYVKYNNIQ